MAGRGDHDLEATAVDTERIAGAVREIIAGLGLDAAREGLRATPRRVAEMYGEVFAGLGYDPLAELAAGFEEGHDELVIVRDITLYSMCEHHFLPFFGLAHVGYIPRGRIVGISKLARVTDILARRPQVQERLTTQIADAIDQALNPVGVAVLIEAEHLCMVMRGVRKPGSRIVTIATRGIFQEAPNRRAEFLQLIGHQHG